MRRPLVIAPLAAVLGLAAALGLAGGTAAQASPARPARISGPEHFRVIGTSVSARSSVLATGAFTAGGYQVSGVVTGLQATDTMVFPDGRLTVRRRITRQVLPLPTSACLVTETVRGTLAIGGGTGAYRGVTGTGAFVQHITEVLPHSRGQCGGRLTAYQSITYEGTSLRS